MMRSKMLSHRWFAVLALAWPLKALAVEIEEIPRDKFDLKIETCDVAVEFGSECCGIDPTTFANVTEFIRVSNLIDRARRYSWGREGEQTYCLSISTPAAAKRIFMEIMDLLPPKQKPLYPISISMPKSDRR